MCRELAQRPALLGRFRSSRLARVAVVAVVAACAPLVATAQQAPAAIAAATAGPTELDLAALRYFLDIGDQASADAEKARLAAAFPGSEIPALAREIVQGGPPDTRPIWRLIEARRFSEARAAIGELQAERPDWVPDDHLLTILDTGAAQLDFDEAILRDDVGAALAAVQQVPGLFACERINNPWRLAEDAAATGQIPMALDIYIGTARNCPDPDHVVATLYKLRVHADAETMESVYAEMRGRYPALGAKIEEMAGESFAAAAAQAAPVAARPGVARAQGQAAGGGGSVLRAARASEAGDHLTCAAALQGDTSAAAMLQRGWCLFNLGRRDEAIAAFRSVERRGTESQRNQARYGLSIALAATGEVAQATQALAGARVPVHQREEARKVILSNSAVESFERKSMTAAIDELEQLREVQGGLDRGQLMMLGYAYLERNQLARARRHFREAHRISPGVDSRLALQRAR